MNSMAEMFDAPLPDHSNNFLGPPAFSTLPFPAPRDQQPPHPPLELLAKARCSHLELQHYKILFICGNYSCILSQLNRNFTELEVRRANTLFQLMTI